MAHWLCSDYGCNHDHTHTLQIQLVKTRHTRLQAGQIRRLLLIKIKSIFKLIGFRLFAIHKNPDSNLPNWKLKSGPSSRIESVEASA
ncbi:hypothetical protein KKA95_02130, partial [Patescibacteria group bacterium]|nr:hypothetical protein [Patescibacteria group bacterium]